MFFWVAAALLTFAAALAVLMPLSRRSGASMAASEINVYRDQLSEIERDVARGLLAGDDAEQARAEIGRRILKADAGKKGANGTAGGKKAFRLASAAAIISVPLISWGLYAALGSPDLPGQPLAERLTRDPSKSTPEELVARAEAQLAANPDDVRGWEVLAPIYIKMQRFSDAANAYRTTLRLGGSNASRQAGLGEALVYLSDGLITKDAQAAFEAALAEEPGMAKARFFLAMVKAQEDDTAGALNDWRSMVSTLPQDDPWREAAQSMLANAAQANVPGGPDEQQVRDAEQMAPQDRAAMIEDMVASLDQKLRENPDDIEGWKRLMRSYLVLGRKDDANAALTRALAALGSASMAAKEVSDFGASLGLEVRP